jgi:DNA-binding transcriptional ArsR family regulator
MAVERNTRAPVLDLSRPGTVSAEIDVSDAAETLVSICALGDPASYDTYDLGPEWLQATRDAVPLDLLDAVDELHLGSLKVAGHLLGVVLETPQPRTFAAFLDQLEATDPVEVKLHLFGAYGTSGPHQPSLEVVERAARGDAAARDEFLASLVEYGEKYEAVRNLLELGPTEVKARLLDLLPRWHDTVFKPHESEWRAAAERDAEAKRELARSHSAEQLAELMTRGYQYTPVPGIRTLAFFPSWWMRPWVLLWEHKGTKVFCYPISGGEGSDRSSPAELARMYKALGDEGRLRLLRRLSESPLTLGEAAAELGLTKSTAHHHLAILRHAGFVTIRDEDENVYSLRRDLLPQAGELLTGYLGSARSSSTRP